MPCSLPAAAPAPTLASLVPAELPIPQAAAGSPQDAAVIALCWLPGLSGDGASSTPSLLTVPVVKAVAPAAGLEPATTVVATLALDVRALVAPSSAPQASAAAPPHGVDAARAFLAEAAEEAMQYWTLRGLRAVISPGAT